MGKLVVAEIADERMGLEEVDLHDLFAVLEQPADILQAPQTEMNGPATGALQVDGGMLPGEGQQALQGPHRLGAALDQQAFSPRAAVGAHHPATFHQVVGAALDDDAFVRVEVGGIGGEAAGLGPDVDGDRLEVLIENAHQPGLGADPHVAAEMLRWHRVVGPLEGDVAVAMHLARRLLEAGKDRGRQRPSRRGGTGCSAWVKQVPTC